MEYIVNKEKCIGCGICVMDCPEGTELKDDGKAEVLDSNKVDNCGGTSICPYDAIEKIGN